MIEQHESFMRDVRARGGRPAAPSPRLAPIDDETPEGVALYQCHAPVPHDGGYHACGKGIEEKPYRPIPIHCDQPMALIGYDWDRDVD